jgi:predicted alpha-1,6-mannanase (GH76 family)
MVCFPNRHFNRSLTNCCSDQMMRWYSASTGVWSDYWWQSANMMSALADLSQLDSSYNGTHFNTYASTYANANQQFGYQNFIDDYYDDEGWWGLAWLNVYDLTKNPNYLNLAISLFNDIHNTGESTPCGGVWWSKDKNYIASIANGSCGSLFSVLGTPSLIPGRIVYPTGRRAGQSRIS